MDYDLQPARHRTARAAAPAFALLIALVAFDPASAATRIPNADPAVGCKASALAEAGDPANLKQSVDSCIAEEKSARAELETKWSTFSPRIQADCVSTVTQYSGPVSYVELLECATLAKEAQELGGPNPAVSN